MSDPKRANVKTDSDTISIRKESKETVRFSINLDESNESTYPEFDYKELMKPHVKQKEKEDERNLETFELKYGGQTAYGKKSGTIEDKFADIAVGYDENDPFIDNTFAHDEKIIPDLEPMNGGFYVNCGSLEFKPVSKDDHDFDDDEQFSERRKKRKLSSSSDSKDSMSESDSQEGKDSKIITNGVDSHDEKKSENSDNENAKKIRRADSSAPTSGRQTSDDNAQGDGDSAETSLDSLTSKPAATENALNMDCSSNQLEKDSGDSESKEELKQLPSSIKQSLEELEALSRHVSKEDAKIDQCISRLEHALNNINADENIGRITFKFVAKILNLNADSKLLQRLATPPSLPLNNDTASSPTNTPQIAQSTAINTVSTSLTNKRKADEVLDNFDVSSMTVVEKEVEIENTLVRLKILIEERKPEMIANYKAECERVEEERRKLEPSKAEAGAGERRRPRRKFPWCGRARGLLWRLAALAGSGRAAAALLAARALPLFPDGFVRMPALLKQADLHKEVKASDLKRPRLGSASQPTPMTNTQYPETLQFPSSLTVTTSVKNNLKDDEKDKYKISSSLPSNFGLNKDLIIEKSENRKREDWYNKEDSFIPNNIGSITITPVTQKDKKCIDKSKEALLRVKSPAALNEMIHKKEKEKVRKSEKTKHPETPHIDNNHSIKQKDLSQKSKDEISQKLIESMRIKENNIPRPALVSIHDSQMFVKPDKRPPEVKKKKEVVIMSDINPLGDNDQETVSLDDSSSDLEIVEDKLDKSELKVSKCQREVPLKDKVKVNSVCEEVTEQDIAGLTRHIQELKNSQEPSNLNYNSYGSVITTQNEENRFL